MRSSPYALAAPPALPIAQEEFDLFRDLIHAKTGISLKDSKQSLLVARLGGRLRSLGLDRLRDYYDYLQYRDPAGAEMRRMINCITTNKTSFFREERHFPVLADYLRKRANAGDPRHASGVPPAPPAKSRTASRSRPSRRCRER